MSSDIFEMCFFQTKTAGWTIRTNFPVKAMENAYTETSFAMAEQIAQTAPTSQIAVSLFKWIASLFCRDRFSGHFFD